VSGRPDLVNPPEQLPNDILTYVPLAAGFLQHVEQDLIEQGLPARRIGVIIHSAPPTNCTTDEDSRRGPKPGYRDRVLLLPVAASVWGLTPAGRGDGSRLALVAGEGGLLRRGGSGKILLLGALPACGRNTTA